MATEERWPKVITRTIGEALRRGTAQRGRGLPAATIVPHDLARLTGLPERQACPGWRGDLAAYLVGALDPQACAAVQRHLGTCPACRAEYDNLVPVLGSLACLNRRPPRHARQHAVNGGKRVKQQGHPYRHRPGTAPPRSVAWESDREAVRPSRTRQPIACRPWALLPAGRWPARNSGMVVEILRPSHLRGHQPGADGRAQSPGTLPADRGRLGPGVTNPCEDLRRCCREGRSGGDGA
jgi:hypothetical protein